MSTALKKLSLKHKFVADGVFYSEVTELFTRELANDGFAGIEIRNTPTQKQIVIRATHTKEVIGEKGQRIRELCSVIRKRFGLGDNVELYVERVPFRGLCAMAQAESVKYKLLAGLVVRKACYSVVRFIMDSGAKGCEVSVSGKARTQRANVNLFRDGYMVKAGNPCVVFKDTATKHVLLRSGVVGIKVVIMLPYDESGRMGPNVPLPDVVRVFDPKDEDEVPAPAAI